MVIVITLPDFFEGEAARIRELFYSGNVDLIHLRKPNSSALQMEDLLLQIPSNLRQRLVLHDHHHLAEKYHLYGVHLNRRNPHPPKGWKGHVSRSCHSLREVVRYKGKLDYLSLSPIFDSISKQGYNSAFSREEILAAHAEGIIDSKVLALGGVTFDLLEEVRKMGFGGAMILGDAWK